MPRKIWQVIRYRQGTLFFTLCLALVLVAVSLPNLDHRGISGRERLCLLIVGLLSLSFGTSLSVYFVDRWLATTKTTKDLSYRIWLGFETALGVPFAIGCVASGCLVIFAVIFE